MPLRQHVNGSNTLYVQYEFGKQYEVDLSLNHDVMTSFTIHKWPDFPNLGQIGQWHGMCARIWPWDSVPVARQTLCMAHVDMGCGKWYEMDLSFNYDVMTLFLLHKGPEFTNLGANLAGVTVYGCTQMPLRQHTSGSNTLCMVHVDVGCRKWSVVDLSLKHDLMTSFSHHNHRWPEFTKSWTNLAGGTDNHPK
jgi:hypothetical protein